jgi:hypothetical protein
VNEGTEDQAAAQHARQTIEALGKGALGDQLRGDLRRALDSADLTAQAAGVLSARAKADHALGRAIRR